MVSSAKNIVRRYLEEVVNTGDLERVQEFVDSNYVDHNDPAGGGIEGAKRHIRAINMG